MNFFIFVERVNQMIAKAGGNIIARFDHDTDLGRFIAHCDDDTEIIAPAGASLDCSGKLKVTVRFGSGHQAMAMI